MTKKGSSKGCSICENLNLPSICTVCVNYRINEYGTKLKWLKGRRHSLYLKLSEMLVAQDKVDDHERWKVLQEEKHERLKKKLNLRTQHLLQEKDKIEKMSQDLKSKYELLQAAMTTLEKNRLEQLEKFYPNLICTQSLGHMAITSERLFKQSVVIKQICKLFPQRRVSPLQKCGKEKWIYWPYDQICNARLPKGLDPHSVPSDELAASMGYMVQLLNLIVHNVAAPALHNSGFAGSCSRIWQRESYWDARPSSRSNEYPLFIPRRNSCSTGEETSWTDRSSSNFGVALMDSERKPQLDSSGSLSFRYSSASPHSVETHKDLQKGISLLKKSVACVTAYCYNSLCLNVPAEMSTFEAFAKLLAMLSSSKEVRSVLSLKMACSRSSKQVQQLNKSVWNVNSAMASSTLSESAHTQSMMRNIYGYGPYGQPNDINSFLYVPEPPDTEKIEKLTEGWDIVEHPTLPPPSDAEDIEHWTRAMIIDATKERSG